MAFGITRNELRIWQEEVEKGNIAFLTHYWMDERFPGCHTVTKAGCSDLEKLKEWGAMYGLQPNWIDMKDKYPHFDLFGERQKTILVAEERWDQIEKFHL